MTELRRWIDEGATPSELRALDEARSLRPSSDVRRRMLAGVGVGAALGVTTASTAAASTTIFGGMLGKALLATVVAAALSGAAWQYRQRSNATSHTAARAQATPVAPPAPEPQIPAPVVAEPVASPAVSPPPSPARPPAAAAPTPSASLSDEVAALDRARRALDSKRPQEALKELEAYRKRFPRGTLAAEQTVLSVEALLARGDNARAIALADRFAAAQPNSAYARRVQDLVKAVRTK
jgi:hypothetical protein